ncbi:glycine zipper 2TM domain-containing protein [Alphaproteobacteria bacterium]|nr:glycine zipper 2TM domain-containing protein [Alphaproteobacteria bacterium]
MSKKFFLLFGLIVLFSSSGYSKTNFYQVTGYVSSVQVLKKYTNQRVPREEKKCSIQRVPVNQNAQKFGADNFIGALIGGAIGNQIGSGGGKSGSTALGALIGSEVVRSEKAGANESYVEKEVCRTQKVFYTETTEQVSGYKLNVEVDGEIISFTSNKSFNPGDLITLTKKISYSLN